MSHVVEPLRQPKRGPACGWLVRVLALLLTVQAFHAATHGLSHRVGSRGVGSSLATVHAADGAPHSRQAVFVGQATSQFHGSSSHGSNGMPGEAPDVVCLLCAVLGNAGHAVQSTIAITVAANHAAAPPPEPLDGFVPLVMVAYASRGPPVVACLNASS